MRSALVALAVLVAVACGPSRPALRDGKGGLAVVAVARQDSDVRAAGVGDPYEVEYPHGREARTYDYDRLEGLVVHVAGSGLPRPADPAVLVYGPGGFEAPVVAACEGQTVRFENRSASPVSFFGVDEASGDGFDDWPTVEPGGSAGWTAAGRGVVLVYAAGDETAEAVLYLPGPGIATLLATGDSLVLAPLPPGRYEVSGWHRVLPATRRTVDVVAGEYAEAQVLFSTDALDE